MPRFVGINNKDALRLQHVATNGQEEMEHAECSCNLATQLANFRANDENHDFLYDLRRFGSELSLLFCDILGLGNTYRAIQSLLA
jgi:hypothetical protein